MTSIRSCLTKLPMNGVLKTTLMQKNMYVKLLVYIKVPIQMAKECLTVIDSASFSIMSVPSTVKSEVHALRMDREPITAKVMMLIILVFPTSKDIDLPSEPV